VVFTSAALPVRYVTTPGVAFALSAGFVVLVFEVEGSVTCFEQDTNKIEAAMNQEHVEKILFIENNLLVEVQMEIKYSDAH
jgi:hypothetical protein